MKKENAKTKLGQFVSENYTTMSAFARSVNEWYGMDIIRIKSRGGAKTLSEWARGASKPRKRHEVWSVVKKYIRAIHKLDVDDTWLRIRNATESKNQDNKDEKQLIMTFGKTDIDEYIKRSNERYERMRKITEQATKLEYSLIGLKEWTDKVSERSEKINRFRDLVKQKITTPHDSADVMVSIRNHGEEDYIELYAYTMSNWDDLMNLIEDRLFIELSNALASLEKNKETVSEIAKQWN